jgi:hypothetical protein
MENKELEQNKKSVHTEDDGRNPDGTFAIGNRAAAGTNIVRAVRNDFRDRLFECITEEDFDNLVKGLLEDINHKDAKIRSINRKLLMEFIVSKPKTQIEAKVESTLSIEEKTKLIKDTILKNLGLVDEV